MTNCSECDNGVGVGYFTPSDTDLKLCRRCYNRWRLENGKQVDTGTRPRYPNGEAIPGFDRERE